MYKNFTELICSKPRSCIYKYVFFLFLLAVTFSPAYALATTQSAQSKNTSSPIVITGKVTNGTGEALAGVTVTEKGAQNFTSTDLNGAYKITVNGNATLVFTYIGYEAHQALVTNSTALNVVLKETTQSLSDVVVIGYGTQKTPRCKWSYIIGYCQRY